MMLKRQLSVSLTHLMVPPWQQQVLKLLGAQRTHYCIALDLPVPIKPKQAIHTPKSPHETESMLHINLLASFHLTRYLLIE